jgi:integrase
MWTRLPLATRHWAIHTRTSRSDTGEPVRPLARQAHERQVDFEFAEVLIAGVPTQGALFVMSLPYADAVSYAVNGRSCRLKAKLGIKHFAYALSHGFATRMLQRGVDHLTAAELMGHSDGSTLARFFTASIALRAGPRPSTRSSHPVIHMTNSPIQ